MTRKAQGVVLGRGWLGFHNGCIPDDPPSLWLLKRTKTECHRFKGAAHKGKLGTLLFIPDPPKKAKVRK